METNSLIFFTSHLSWEVLRPRKDILEKSIISLNFKLENLKTSDQNIEIVMKAEDSDLGRRTMTMGERKARRESRATRN